jgi:hypothetical protein
MIPNSDCSVRPRLKLFGAALLFSGLTFALSSSASVPVPEKLLPDDTLVVVTIPDFSKARDMYTHSPQSQIWDDPAFKPFKDHFLAKWKEEVVQPLERELDIRLDDFTSLPQGQVTFALIQNGWQGREGESLGTVFLVDARDKSDQLKKNLASLRKKWVDSGKSMRTEKIRDIEFFVFPLSSNDVPKTIRKFFPDKPEVQELGADNEPVKKPVSKSELVIGQADSLLILANSTKAAEKIAARVGGGSLPALADLAAFQGNRESLFRDAPLYAWMNVKAFVDILNKLPVEKKDNDAAPDPFGGANPQKILAATGLSGLRTLAFTTRNSAEGFLMQIFLGAPESGRSGLFKILAGEPKETMPPPFVPADAVKFFRWRLDGQKAWAALEKMLNDISPQAGNSINMLLDMASSSAKEKDPSFDVRKNLIGNLGDDMISYSKTPRGSTLAEISSAPGIFLLGSPNPEQLVAAMRSIFAMTGAQTGAASEREFLGRKIFSAPLPGLPIPGAGGGSGAKKGAILQYAASSGYVALTTDASLIEEFLRSSESKAKSLRDTPGLIEASQKVIGPGTGMFGYENQAETMKTTFELLRKNPDALTNSATGGLNPLTSALGMGTAEKGVKDLFDFSLLPPFERISKYFYISVYGAGATSEGLNLKVFAPMAPGLKGAAK